MARCSGGRPRRHHPIARGPPGARHAGRRRRRGDGQQDRSVKGHRVLLAALERMRAVPGWTCWIVGGAQSPDEEAYERELRSAARVFDLEAPYPFHRPSRRRAALLAAADVYCQPNTAPEAFGLSCSSRRCYAGLPVITSGIGGPLEILDRRAAAVCCRRATRMRCSERAAHPDRDGDCAPRIAAGRAPPARLVLRSAPPRCGGSSSVLATQPAGDVSRPGGHAG